MAEAKLQKLKVTELKELLSKAGLVQSGKKDELVKRLVDSGWTGDESEELVDLPDEPALAVPAGIQAAVSAPAPASTTAPAAVSAPAPASAAPSHPAAAPPAADAAPADPPAEDVEEQLTEEEKKQKKRAERFNIPWVRETKPAAPAKPAQPAKADKPAPVKDEPTEKTDKVKPAAIDATPLGISADVLARRAAKWGLPEKKAASPEKKEPSPTKELSTEEAAALAAEEEKKRKRAEKYGTAANGSDEPDAKKAKV